MSAEEVPAEEVVEEVEEVEEEEEEVSMSVADALKEVRSFQENHTLYISLLVPPMA